MLPNSLPDDFLAQLSRLETSYLAETDPIRQSGFSGGAERWRAEREPIVQAIHSDGDILDVGCANGHLLECLVAWAWQRGIRLTPFGLDHSAHLIALARERFPQYADHFYVGNGWDWQPPRRFRYVYSVHDCVPEDLLAPYIARLLGQVVLSGGLLILGAYGNRGRGIQPLDLHDRLVSFGYVPVGATEVGAPPIARFAWLAA